MGYELDHVVLATADLDASVHRIMAVHPWTPMPPRTMAEDEDWIAVPVGGGSYIDIGCARRPVTRTSALLADAAGDSEAFCLWVLRSSDCREDAERLGLSCVEHERDGTVVVRTAGLDEGLESGGVVPCFVTYVAQRPAALLSGGGGLYRVTIGDPENLLALWVPELPGTVAVVRHPPRGIREVRVNTRAGPVTLG